MLLEAGVQYALDFINTQGTPVAACTAAGLCPKKADDVVAGGSLFASPALSNVITQGAAATAAANASATVAATAPGGPDCLKCKFAVETVGAHHSLTTIVHVFVSASSQLR
jgi:hypothetical protein